MFSFLLAALVIAVALDQAHEGDWLVAMLLGAMIAHELALGWTAWQNAKDCVNRPS